MSSGPTETSVYVHFPWCAKKCPYCDFATVPVEVASLPHDAYADALLRELEAREADLAGRSLKSVFFGGGTPSLWAPEALQRSLEAIRGAFDVEVHDLEVTVECNPSSLTRKSAALLREAGVGRLSIGAQSLRDRHLRFLGRIHDAERALASLRDAVREMPRVSVDLMFGMPHQTSAELGEDIACVVDAGAGHVSAYSLTIEEHTPFGALHRAGRLLTASEEQCATLFEHASACFADLGWTHYEVSNFAARRQESRHNQHYWRGGAYVGLGAAAVGCLDHGPGRAERWRNEPNPQRYLRSPVGEAQRETLGPDEIVREALMLGLRTLEGVSLATTARRAGRALEAGRERELARALRRGDLVRGGDRLRVPQSRWLKLDGIVRDLF